MDAPGSEEGLVEPVCWLPNDVSTTWTGLLAASKICVTPLLMAACNVSTLVSGVRTQTKALEKIKWTTPASGQLSPPSASREEITATSKKCCVSASSAVGRSRARIATYPLLPKDQ